MISLNKYFSDINECTDGTHNCHPNASCTDNGPSFICTCDPGYTGDGTVCEGKLINNRRL
jgi:hypothetical protein